MPQIDKDRFSGMAACYDRMAEYLVPQYAFLQEQTLDLIFADGREDRRIVDLGAGSGIFLERALRRSGASTGVWVDSSEDFLRVAEERLREFGSRVQYILCRLEDGWEAQLAGVPDAIASMSAIHHLASEEKKRLYRRCWETLAPGGWFYNIDEVASPWPDAYMNTMRYWVRHVQAASGRVPAALADDCRAWQARFEQWKKRNIGHAGQEKLPGDDIHDSYVEQVQWLREVGFMETDLFIKYQLWAVMGGRRPA